MGFLGASWKLHAWSWMWWRLLDTAPCWIQDPVPRYFCKSKRMLPSRLVAARVRGACCHLSFVLVPYVGLQRWPDGRDTRTAHQQMTKHLSASCSLLGSSWQRMVHWQVVCVGQVANGTGVTCLWLRGFSKALPNMTTKFLCIILAGYLRIVGCQDAAGVRPACPDHSSSLDTSLSPGAILRRLLCLLSA